MSALMSDDIAEIWRSINPKLIFQKNQNTAIAYAVNACTATARIVGQQDKERKKLKKAFDLIGEWCAAHRREIDDIFMGDDQPPQPIYDARIVALEQALQAIPGEYIAPVTRSWTIAAPTIWQAAGRELRSIGKPAGTAATALAVRFTSALLNRVGYQNVTPDAVRKEVEKYRMSKGRGVATPYENDT